MTTCALRITLMPSAFAHRFRLVATIASWREPTIVPALMTILTRHGAMQARKVTAHGGVIETGRSERPLGVALATARR